MKCQACHESGDGPLMHRHKCVTHQVCCPEVMGDEDDPFEHRSLKGEYWAEDAAETYAEEVLDVEEHALIRYDSTEEVLVRTRQFHGPNEGPTWGPWVKYAVSGEAVPKYHATKVKGKD